MSININLKIQKKDLWLLSAIVVFLVGVGYVIAYDWATGSGTGLPSIHGHTANEIEGVVAGIEYDSGWFAITTSTTYTLNHGLGVEPPIVLLYIAENPDGSGKRASGNGANDFGVDGSGPTDYHSRGTTIASVDSSQIKIRTGIYGVARVRDVNGNIWNPGNAYARIIAGTSLGGSSGSSGIQMKTGTYTGDGTDNRDIDIGVDLASATYKWIAIKGETNTLKPIQKFGHKTGDLTDFFDSDNPSADYVQAWTATGFQIGTNTRVNQNTIVYSYVVFYQQ